MVDQKSSRDWSTGTYRYIYFKQICQSICLRIPKAKFYAKGSEKTKLLTELLERIGVQLRTETGRIVPFTGTGKVILALIFKKFD